MRHGDLLFSAVVITTLAGTLTGCSRNPVAPSTNLTGPGAGSATVGYVPEAPPAGGDGGTPSTRTETFVATSEGAMTVGRWTLWFRKNSLTMPATITMKVTDPEAMDVQIDVQPAAANNFNSPVVLTANMSDVPGFDYTTGDMEIWGGGDWQALPSKTASSHPNQQNVIAHFTTLSNTLVMNDTGKFAAQ